MNDESEGSAIGLDEIATAPFRTTDEGDKIAQRLKDAMGFGAFNAPARLAIARSLAIASPPMRASGDPGRVIKGETLFGTGVDLATWIALLIEHTGTPLRSLGELQKLITAHWTRGLQLLDGSLTAANGDRTAFWRDLASSTLPQSDGDDASAPPSDPPSVVAALTMPVGEVAEDASTGARVLWPLNAAGGSPHAAFMGGVGSGKTRTACFMLRALREQQSVPLLAFDFKGDMSDNRNALDRAFGATVIAPPHQAIPLDVLTVADRSPTGIKLAAQRLRDSLATLKGSGFGSSQKNLLADAAEQALRGKLPCRLADVRDALRAVYADERRKEDGAVATLTDLSRFELFRPDLLPAEFFSRSWIVRLTADLPDLVKTSVVTLMTDALDRHLNGLSDSATDGVGNRALRVVCVIDEAHRILGTKLPGLTGLIRLSRSKGGAVLLISQSPDDFTGEDEEFLDNMGLVVAFRTNANPGPTRRILGPAANLATLDVGQAWVKLSGEPAPRRVVAWR